MSDTLQCEEFCEINIFIRTMFNIQALKEDDFPLKFFALPADLYRRLINSSHQSHN